MTRDEQIEFVQSVGMLAINLVCNDIEHGHIPESWKESELLELFSGSLKSQWFKYHQKDEAYAKEES